MRDVARAFRKKYKDIQFRFYADNDCNSNYNTGIEKAREAAEEVGNAIVLYPVWMDKNKKPIQERSVDWNDIYCEYEYEVKMIKLKIDVTLQNMEQLKQVKFYIHEAKISKENKIYMKGE